MSEKKKEPPGKEIGNQEAKFRAVFEQAAIGMARMGIDGRWLEVNQKFCDIVGYLPEELMGLTFQEITYPDDLDTDLEYVHHLISGEIEDYSIEKRYIRKDGSVIWINLTGSGVRKPSGEPEYFIITVEDISEKKRAQVELQESERLLRETQTISKVCGWEYDVENHRLKWTDEAYRIQGLPPGSYDPNVSGAIELYTPVLEGVIEQAFQKAVSRGEPYDLVLEFTTARGQHLWIRTIGRAVRRDGKTVRVAGSIIDITELKQSQEQKQRIAEVEAANRELEAFSYSISHDLKTPLRAIDGFSQIIMDDYRDRLDEEGQRLLNVVRDNVQKMGDLIDGILTLSRLGRRQIKPSEIDMRKLAQSTFEELRATVPERKIVFKMENSFPVHGDRMLIQQVMSNLLGNAIKFTVNEETAVIEVCCSGENGESVCCVKDNGAGFDMQYADKLFGIFQRLHADEEFEGTGVGLSIVQRIIYWHGGRVWAEGKVDDGATIYFALPEERWTNERAE